MSVEVLIIPAALGIAALQARQQNEGKGPSVEVQTRLKSPALLSESLVALGAKVTRDHEITIAEWSDMTVSFTPSPGGELSAFCPDHGVEERLVQRIGEIDRTYARLVQRDTVNHVRRQVGQMGLVLESEMTNADDSVTFTIEVV